MPIPKWPLYDTQKLLYEPSFMLLSKSAQRGLNKYWALQGVDGGLLLSVPFSL